VQFFQEINIADEWRSTGGTDVKPFLVYDNGPEAASQMLVSASEEGLKHLGARRWFSDGTFFAAPSIFDQLYVIRAILGDTCVSCVYALLPGRTQEIYEELFRAVVNAGDVHDVTLDPNVITVDFEKVLTIR